MPTVNQETYPKYFIVKSFLPKSENNMSAQFSKNLNRTFVLLESVSQMGNGAFVQVVSKTEWKVDFNSSFISGSSS